jgi:hypothetical protein
MNLTGQAHTGFDDPTTLPDHLPCEGIEVRALVFLPPRASS